MPGLGHRLYEQRSRRYAPAKRGGSLSAQGLTAGLFLGIALLLALSAFISRSSPLPLLGYAALSALYLASAILVALAKRAATWLGCLALGIVAFLLLFDLVSSGASAVGLAWIAALFFAAKKLADYDAFLGRRKRGSKKKNGWK